MDCKRSDDASQKCHGPPSTSVPSNSLHISPTLEALPVPQGSCSLLPSLLSLLLQLLLLIVLMASMSRSAIAVIVIIIVIVFIIVMIILVILIVIMKSRKADP